MLTQHFAPANNAFRFVKTTNLIKVRRARFELATLRIGNESATTAPTPLRQVSELLRVSDRYGSKCCLSSSMCYVL